MGERRIWAVTLQRGVSEAQRWWDGLRYLERNQQHLQCCRMTQETAIGNKRNQESVDLQFIRARNNDLRVGWIKEVVWTRRNHGAEHTWHRTESVTWRDTVSQELVVAYEGSGFISDAAWLGTKRLPGRKSGPFSPHFYSNPYYTFIGFQRILLQIEWTQYFQQFCEPLFTSVTSYPKKVLYSPQDIFSNYHNLQNTSSTPQISMKACSSIYSLKKLFWHARVNLRCKSYRGRKNAELLTQHTKIWFATFSYLKASRK